jgi:hypothetical protein
MINQISRGSSDLLFHGYFYFLFVGRKIHTVSISARRMRTNLIHITGRKGRQAVSFTRHADRISAALIMAAHILLTFSLIRSDADSPN